MPEDLCFVVINPYPIRKSRTGGIIGRLLSRSSLELVAARMYAPSAGLVSDYLDAIPVSAGDPAAMCAPSSRNTSRKTTPVKEGHRRRVMFLLFKGRTRAAS